MDISEIRKKHYELEKQIEYLINKFEEKTDTCVGDIIRIERVETTTKDDFNPVSEIIKIDINVHL